MAEKLLYLTNTNSDLTVGSLFSKYLRPATGTAANISVALTKDVALTGYGFSYANEIDLRVGTGVITVKVEVQTAATATCRIRAHRISSTGSVLASTDWTAAQSLGTIGTKTFTTASVDWTGASASDRLRIDYEFVTTDHSASPAIRVGIANASVETPFTHRLITSVDAAGGGTTNPAAGTYDYVVAGRVVTLTAIPTDKTKKFVKWVINSVDVTENPTTVTMNQDITAVAHFTDASQHDLIVSVETGTGTVDPIAGTYQKYEQESIVIEAAATTEGYNAKIIVNSTTVFDNEEFFGRAEFIMPAENTTVKVYFIAPFVRIERSNGNNTSWGFLVDVNDPDTMIPADYLDTNGFQGTVEYFYRANRIEGNYDSGWSNESSVIYEAVTLGNVTVSPPSGAVQFTNVVPVITAQRGCQIYGVTGITETEALLPSVTSIQNTLILSVTGELQLAGYFATISGTISALIASLMAEIELSAIGPTIVCTANITVQSPASEIESVSFIPNVTTQAFKDAIISAVYGEVHFSGQVPSVSVQQYAIVISTVGEFDVDPVPPNVAGAQNAHIINLPPPATQFEGLSPNIETAIIAVVAPDPGQTTAQGLPPNVSAVQNTSILSATSEFNFEGLSPSILIIQSASIQATCGEFLAIGKLPSTQTTKNAHIDADVGLSFADGLSPTVTSTVGAPVLTASQIDEHIYVEWGVV